MIGKEMQRLSRGNNEVLFVSACMHWVLTSLFPFLDKVNRYTSFLEIVLSFGYCPCVRNSIRRHIHFKNSPY